MFVSAKILEELAVFFSQSYKGQNTPSKTHLSFYKAIQKANAANAWFTKENIQFAIENWSHSLNAKNTQKWLKKYTLPNAFSDKTVAVICAGNIPFVGLHDLLCVILAGHRAIVKCSKKDYFLLAGVVAFLKEQFPELTDRIIFTEGIVSGSGIDAVIATGSDNTHRYFEYYFSKYPHILRKNRNSVAVLNGSEPPEKLALLCDDIFTYFGLGCRNVSKIFVPRAYDFNPLFKASLKYKHLIDHPKYKNNYDYQKSIYLLSDIPMLTNDLFLLTPLENNASPIAVLGYEYYDCLENIADRLKKDQEKIQCIVTDEKIAGAVSFGKSQKPSISCYSDGVDTLNFLLTL